MSEIARPQRLTASSNNPAALSFRNTDTLRASMRASLRVEPLRAYNDRHRDQGINSYWGRLWGQEGKNLRRCGLGRFVAHGVLNDADRFADDANGHLIALEHVHDLDV